MRKRIFGLVVCLLLISLNQGGVSALSALEDTASFVSGKEWMIRMTPKEKMMSLLPPMALYHKFGVKFQKTIFEYIDALDEELASHPLLEGEDVANIFASTIYAGEPENRPPLDRMGAVFELLKKRDSENLYPAIPITEG